ncbi:MAG: hypothetical protein J6U21_08970 [Bacteroidales bacterium]|nr:hypothetical protein [Bacteroidales bacterium]MBP5369301.1 hypothetical protein [Bacteroidales bacterium]
MKNNIVFALIIVVALSTIIACYEEKRSVDELRQLFNGVFLLDAKRNGEPPNSLHYIVFYQDSTYVHTYINDGITLSHKGKWVLGIYKRDQSIYFDLLQWLPYGNDPFRDYHYEEYSAIPHFGTDKDDWASLQFDIDLGYEFEKISPYRAKILGIVY